MNDEKQDPARPAVAHAATTQETSVITQIFRTMLTVGGLTGLVSVVKVGQDLVIAYQFGTTAAVDAFILAWTIPVIAVTVLVNPLTVSLMPVYIRLLIRNANLRAANSLLTGFLAIFLLLLVLLTVSLQGASPGIARLLTKGLDRQALELSETLLNGLLLTLPVLGGIRLYAAVLNAHSRFWLPAATPALGPLAAIASAMAFGDELGVYSLAFGLASGLCVELVVLTVSAHRTGLLVKPKWIGWSPEVREVIGQYLPMAAGALMMSSTTLIDRGMAAWLGQGSVAQLTFGSKISTFAVGLVTVTVGTAILPHFSRLVAHNRWGEISRTYRFYSILVSSIIVPLVAVAYFWATDIIRIVFEHGAFTSRDTEIVAQTFRFHVLHVPFYILGILTVRILSSLQANHIMMWGALINVTANITFNYILMQEFGVAGIALSTSIVYLLSFLFLWANLIRIMRLRADPERC